MFWIQSARKFARSHQVSIILPKIRWKRFKKLTDHNYLYLQRFDKIWIWISCRKRKWSELGWLLLLQFREKSWNHIKRTDFRRENNSLTNFEHKSMTGNGKSSEFADSCFEILKNSWNHIKRTYFWRENHSDFELVCSDLTNYFDVLNWLVQIWT